MNGRYTNKERLELLDRLARFTARYWGVGSAWPEGRAFMGAQLRAMLQDYIEKEGLPKQSASDIEEVPGKHFYTTPRGWRGPE